LMANMYITDIQHAVLMRAEVTADNTSIRVLWELVTSGSAHVF